MKDCIFQYATSDGVVLEDTDLISRADAEELWQKYIPQFKRHVEEGREPEMAIWIDMEDDTNFRKMASHWCGSDMVIENGSMYQKKLVAL